jgi:hypothetical protein
VPDDPPRKEPRPPGEIISLALLVVGAIALVIVFAIVGRALR